MSHPFDVAEIAATYASKSPQDVLKFAFEHFGDDLWISFSGAEDVVLLDMAWKINKNVKVFSLDTGRLHPETYRFIEQVREHYGIAIEVMTPDPRLLEPFVREKGLFSFYKDGHGECCGIRKIEPLKRKLSTVTAWATGQRKDQSPGTRSQVAVVELDSAFSTLPAENASGNWVKVVQRIPIRVSIDQKPGDPPLRSGMSAVVKIDTGKRRLERLLAEYS